MRIIHFVVLTLAVTCAHAEPPAGHPSVNDAQRMLQMPPAEGLAYKGRVVQAIDSNDYTYIEVTVEDGKTRWLAAPRLMLHANNWIRYGDGRVMRNFYSRKHQRTFNEVWFISQVQILGN